MKKQSIFLASFLTVFCFLFSCQETEPQVDIAESETDTTETEFDLKTQAELFDAMYAELFEQAEVTYFENVKFDTVSSVLEVPTCKMIDQSVSTLQSKYALDWNGVKRDFSKEIADELSQHLYAPNARSTAYSMPYLSTAQRNLINPYITRFENAWSATSAINISHELNNTIYQSSLSTSEKNELLSMSLAFKKLAEFFGNGGAQRMKRDLERRVNTPHSIAQGINGREQGCEVDWRSVWGSAVIGLAVGAAQGGYAGATAGTFAAPVLGTATGGVGGAVFGGAAGFVSGALTGVAGNLLHTCFRGGGGGSDCPASNCPRTKCNCD